MRQLFRDHLAPDIIDEAINNTVEVANKVEEPMRAFWGIPRFLTFRCQRGTTARTYMAKVARDGLLDRT